VKTAEQLDQETQAANNLRQQDLQRELIMTGLKSPALGQVAANYTQPGAPYGPQFPEGSDPSAPGAVPNALPEAQSEPGLPAGPTG